MSQPYGPALIIGILIGGAIIFDDHLAPQSGDQKRVVTMATDGENLPVSVQAPLPHQQSKAVASKRHKIVMAIDAEHAPGSSQVVDISLEVDGDASGVTRLPSVIRAVLETAEAENRVVTPEEIEAAVVDTLGDSALQDISIIVDDQEP